MSYVQVGLPQLLISLGLVAMALAISAQEKLGLERDLLVATLRSAIQLFAIGVVLTFLFQHERPGWVLALLGTLGNILAALMYNLISDLVGGIRFQVVDDVK